MAHKSYRQESRTDWGTSQEGNLNIEQINCGAILRITDATEKMATNHIRLQSDYDFMRNSRDSWQREAEHLKRSNAALRGHLKRIKSINQPQITK